MTDFAAHALVDDEYVLPTEERLRRTVENPASRGALSLPTANRITTARIRYALSELAHDNAANVQKWLEQVANTSPAKAIELYIELMQFSMPKLKAIAVDARVSDAQGQPRALSLAELQSIISEQ